MTENKGEQVQQLKSEVEAALSRYEKMDTYQWGATSPELEKYKEKTEIPQLKLKEKEEIPFPEGEAPVSYTHLDVYKRQV